MPLNAIAMNKKVSCKRVRPNARFEDWLLHLCAEAKAKKSHFEPMLKEAAESLAKYPLPLKTASECIILKGFNKKLCLYLDKCLTSFNEKALSNNCENRGRGEPSHSARSTTISPIPSSQHVTRSISNSPLSESFPNLGISGPLEINPSSRTSKTDSEISENVSSDSGPLSSGNKKKRGIASTYKPAYRSGGYAILVTLLEQSKLNPNCTMTKELLIEKAQIHCEESFVRPKAGSMYTAWSNMSRLLTKGLVTKTRKKNAEYSLTSEGERLATELLDASTNIPTVNDMIFNDIPSTSSSKSHTSNPISNTAPKQGSSTSQQQSFIDMKPGEFDIILLIDKNETGGLKKRNDPTIMEFNKYPDLKHDYRSLKVGDFTWIAKHKKHPEQELVLPYVVERKRMDDLAASIKDGRFHEQKFRLRRCGLKNVIYLVEKYDKNKGLGLPLPSLLQALTNTRVQDGFKVRSTNSLNQSVRFLAMMTKRLTIRYGKMTLRNGGEECDDSDDMKFIIPQAVKLMTFEYFNKSSAKTKPLTVKDTFIKLLLQLKGVSVEKALAITNRYPTPHSLIVAYYKCDQQEGEILLASLKYGDQTRNIGPALSKSVYHLFSTLNPK
ncbi:crossover junction endonuclease MUS81 [Spodoptera litura]|uniref:Crossover junction endonuclease MUS81 n=1 Tax=Spodoptera litura TaxID=69820 RepID=A0A9J7EIN3_SPOLT|nr:crossover junction endonuclease MUS81 [Spodoptera litura]